MGGIARLRFLLDTHIWIWSLLEPDHLTRKVRKALELEENELWLSPISIWEAMVLVQKGKVVLNLNIDEWIREAIATVPMKEAPITFEVARLSRSIHLDHLDPADRFLAATAAYLKLTLITADKRLMKSRDYAVLPNL
jgi:PIN domain nuclease of toxin-antitoxin system